MTAEDLVTKRQIQISEGDFYTVMVASFALPVYFPPVSYQGHRLIDGGITNLVPVGIAGEFTDSIILSTTFYENEELNLNNPVTILNVSFDISKRRRGIEEMKALEDSFIWIRNDVESISFMEFAKVMYLQEKGYEAAKAQSEALEKLKRGVPVLSFAKRREALDESIRFADRQYAAYEHLCRFGCSGAWDRIWSTSATRCDPISSMIVRGSLLHGIKRTLSIEINGGLAFNWAEVDRCAPSAIKTRLYYYFLDHWRVAFGGGSSMTQKEGFLFPTMGCSRAVFAWQDRRSEDKPDVRRALQRQEHRYVEAFPDQPVGDEHRHARTAKLEMAGERLGGSRLSSV